MIPAADWFKTAAGDVISPRRRSLALAILTVAAGALLGCSSALAAGTPRPPAPSYLFSIPSASGSLTGHGDRHLKLRLTRTRNYLTRFTDRPLRQAFVVANVDFARRFKTYFSGDAPNAVLTYARPGSRIPVSIVLTVRHPRWNARHRTWTFSATRIRKQPDNSPGTTVHIKPPSIANPRSFTGATLLIDDAGSCIDGPDYDGENCAPVNSCAAPYYSGQNCVGANLANANLAGADLSGVDLTGANLAYANLVGALFDSDTGLAGISLTSANLAGVDLSGLYLTRANLSGANLTGANLAGASLVYANLSLANLTGANLTNVDFTDAGLELANLTGANLTGAILNSTSLCATTMPSGVTLGC